MRKIEAERDALRDSRDRLQEALRAAEQCGSDEVSRIARAALSDAPKSGLNVLTAAQHSLAETSGDEDMSWVELSENTWRHP